jgi:hypothetical protein
MPSPRRASASIDPPVVVSRSADFSFPHGRVAYEPEVHAM